VISHRATTSSRHPAHIFRGTIHVATPGLQRCEKCGGYYLAYAYGHPHAPRFDAQKMLVDCAGDVVEVRP